MACPPVGGRAQAWEQKVPGPSSIPGPEQKSWPGFTAASWGSGQLFLQTGSAPVPPCPGYAGTTRHPFAA